MADGPAKDIRMKARGDLIAAIRTAYNSYLSANADISTQLAAAQAIMAGVTTNSISAQNITDLNTALAAAVTDNALAGVAITSAVAALNTSQASTGESTSS